MPKALDIAIDACKRQIEIAPQAKKAFLRNYKDSILPAHVGYKQLAIIEEKQKNYVEAIRICSEAMGQGWGGDWQKRVERCKKKIQK